jgi:hypothetical protein
MLGRLDGGRRGGEPGEVAGAGVGRPAEGSGWWGMGSSSLEHGSARELGRRSAGAGSQVAQRWGVGPHRWVGRASLARPRVDVRRRSRPQGVEPLWTAHGLPARSDRREPEAASPMACADPSGCPQEVHTEAHLVPSSSPGVVDAGLDASPSHPYGADTRSPATDRRDAPRGRERHGGTGLGISRSAGPAPDGPVGGRRTPVGGRRTPVGGRRTPVGGLAPPHLGFAR